MNFALESKSNLIPISEKKPMIRTWSHARWSNFEKCKLRARLLYIDKEIEPERPLAEGQTEQPNTRGERVHTAAEAFVRGGSELIPELQSFSDEFAELQRLYAAGKVSLEGEWGHDVAWASVPFHSPEVWLRLKLDAMVFITDVHGLVIDYKTGRRFGNELKHAQQTQLYTVATLLRYPQLQRVTTELWYTDQNDLCRIEYTREQGLRFFKTWNQHGIEITSATAFPPNPNKYSCMYCRLGPKGSGVCSVGV